MLNRGRCCSNENCVYNQTENFNLKPVSKQKLVHQTIASHKYKHNYKYNQMTDRINIIEREIIIHVIISLRMNQNA